MKVTILRFSFICGLILGLLFSADARVKNRISPLRKPTGDNKLAMDKVHKVGTLWNTNSNFGRYGDPNAASTGRPSMEWPGGSRIDYLWEGRLWVGGVVNGEIRVSHADYGNYEFWPTPGTEFYIGPGKSIEDHVVVYDDLDPFWHSTAPLGIRVIERGLTWSLPDYDDFIAYEYEIINVSDELPDGPYDIKDFYVSWVYDCDVGTVADPTDPHIDDLVDYDGWDGTSSDTDIEDIVENVDLNGNGKLDGYDEWGIPYGWEYLGSRSHEQPNYDPSKISPDGFWDEWSVILDPNGPPLRWQSDVPELGRKAGEIAIVNGDTLRGYCVPRNTSYMYDADNSSTAKNDTGERDEPWGPVDGFVGGALIYTDHLPYYTAPEDTLRRPYSHQWWNWESDPGSDLEKYQYMTATHVFSVAPFQPNPLTLGAPEFDYRWMTTTGPFDFKPGDTLRFVYVAAVGHGLMGMRQNIDNALRAYYSGSKHSNPYKPSPPNKDLHWVLPIPPPQPNLVYNPGYNSVHLTWDNIAETTIDPMLGRVDFRGYKVYRAMYAPRNWQMIAAFDNVDEVVPVVTTEGDTLGWTNLPPIQHSFVDTGGVFMGRKYDRPLNGLPYYYAVVAYDPDKPAEGGRPALRSIESPRNNYMTDPTTGAPLPVFPKGLYEYDASGKVTPGYDISKVTVVPNPYKGTSIFEERYQEKVIFQNLPPACKISIYTITGDHVITIQHTSGTSQEEWNLKSRNEQYVKTGLYIYVVETENAKKIGKLVLLR